MTFIKIVLFIVLVISFGVAINIVPEEVRGPVTFWGLIVMLVEAAFLISFMMK